MDSSSTSHYDHYFLRNRNVARVAPTLARQPIVDGAQAEDMGARTLAEVPGDHALREEDVSRPRRLAPSVGRVPGPAGPQHDNRAWREEDVQRPRTDMSSGGRTMRRGPLTLHERIENLSQEEFERLYSLVHNMRKTRRETLECAMFLIGTTSLELLERFASSPTGIVEAVQYYSELTRDRQLIQVVTSQVRNGTVRDQVLNGSRGSWTGTDDVATTATQLSLLRGFGTVDVDSRFAFRGCPAYPFIPPTGYLYGFVYTFEPYSTTVGGTQTSRYAHFDEFWDMGTLSTEGSAFTIANYAALENAIVDICCPTYGLGFYADYRTPTSSPNMQWYVLSDALAFNYLVREVEALAPPAGVAGVAFLNGANGEATNKDDVKKGARSQQKKGTPRRQRRAAPRRKVGRRSQPRSNRPALGMSPCSLKYARAIADPFHPDAVGACVPVFPSPDSQKVHSVQRSVTMVVGAGGVGGCFLSPSTSNDGYNIAVTTAQYAQTYLYMPQTEVLGDFGLSSPASLPYAFGTLQAAVEIGAQARIVSFGVRVTYTGTQVDMGGTIAGFFEPNHYPVALQGDAQPANIAWDMSAITARPYAAYESVDRRMNFCLSTAAVTPSETVFEQSLYPYCQRYGGESSSYTAIQSNAIGLIMVVGKPGVTFNVEVVTHVEYTGAPANASLTRTHTDARGFEMVQQASGQLASATANNRKSSWSVMTSLLADAARELAPVAISAISAYNPAAGSLARIAGRAAGFH